MKRSILFCLFFVGLCLGILVFFFLHSPSKYRITWNSSEERTLYYQDEVWNYYTIGIDDISVFSSWDSFYRPLSEALEEGWITVSQLLEEGQEVTRLDDGMFSLYHYSNFAVVRCQTVYEDHVRPRNHLVIGPLTMTLDEREKYCS